MTRFRLRWHLVAVLLLPLPSCAKANVSADMQREVDAREQLGRAVAVDAGASRALAVASRADVLFEEGFSNVEYDPPDDFRHHAFRWMGQRGHVRLKSHERRPMRLSVKGWLNEKVIRAKAVVTLYINGRRLGSSGAVEDGHWSLETVVPSSSQRTDGWLDLVVTVSAVAFHWSDAPTLRVVVVTGLEWRDPALGP